MTFSTVKFAKASIVRIVGVLLLSLTAIHTGLSQELPEPWIAYPTANTTAYGVYHFRKSFDWQENADNPLVIHVSADNRYKLYVNGTRVACGPAKGDLETYKYDVIDIAPFIQEGENIIAAEVFNMGKDKPMAFLSVQTAFMLRTEDPAYSSFINTSEDWKVIKNEAYDPITYNELFEVRWFYGYYACGPGDELFADKYPWGWEEVNYDDSNWVTPQLLDFAQNPWNLVPRNIAMMDSFREHPEKIRRVRGVPLPTGDFASALPITIPANSKAEIIIDFEIFTMGYPKLHLSGGEGSTIQINYAEALYEDINIKGHRDSVGNLTMYGVFDIFHPDGKDRIYEPLWKRAFRYVQFKVETGDAALTLLGYENEFSGYPYDEPATFESDSEVLNEIFAAAFQTFRMCSAETYYDTPYYEQLSYGGDNRPISAISSYNTTDDRLFREVMRLYPQSANAETNLFASAYPSRFDFDQGTWSMAWIQSLADYYRIRGDIEFAAQFTDKIEGVLNYYLFHMDESNNLLGPITNQNFMDWSITKGSIPRVGRNVDEPLVNSIMLSLYYAHTLDEAAVLYEGMGESEKAEKWTELSEKIKRAGLELGWDESKGLLGDDPDFSSFSQHTNLMAILTNTVPHEQQEKLFLRILEYDDFDEYASSYFSFFLYKAMQKVGREDLFQDHMGFYKTFLERGHTTMGETGFASHDRSDCHAWSAHPNFYLLNITAGIKSDTVGFESVRVSPTLGNLKALRASIPHPKGRISVSYKLRGNKLAVEIQLPDGLAGTWDWHGEKRELSGGMNTFTAK